MKLNLNSWFSLWRIKTSWSRSYHKACRVSTLTVLNCRTGSISPKGRPTRRNCVLTPKTKHKNSPNHSKGYSTTLHSTKWNSWNITPNCLWTTNSGVACNVICFWHNPKCKTRRTRVYWKTRWSAGRISSPGRRGAHSTRMGSLTTPSTRRRRS